MKKSERNGSARTRGAAAQPVWRKIEDKLRAEIVAGKYGEKLPPEGEIAEHFGVNRITARQALASLQTAGFIRIERGRGTFVQKDVVAYGLGERVRFSQNLLAAKLTPSRRLIKSSEIPADFSVAARLEISERDPVILLAVVGEGNGEPLMYGLNYYPADRFQGLPAAFQETGSLTKALAACGVADYRRKTTELIARLPTPEEARHLHQPRNEPIVETTGVDVDGANVPIALGITCFAAARMRFVLDHRAE
jgi:GntR family transcriptional regulator, phosphonate transport system regulatory protein